MASSRAIFESPVKRKRLARAAFIVVFFPPTKWDEGHGISFLYQRGKGVREIEMG
jgi:hypothetical protein